MKNSNVHVENYPINVEILAPRFSCVNIDYSISHAGKSSPMYS